MPRLRTTKQIFKDLTEINTINYDESNSDHDLPPRTAWDYSRELKLEDVDVWEVIYEEGGGTGVYASWEPYAEFYMLRLNEKLEFFYGAGSQKFMLKYLKTAWNIDLTPTQKWIDPEYEYLFDDKTFSKHPVAKELINPIGTIFDPETGLHKEDLARGMRGKENDWTKQDLNCCN